jgi:hypothetical protein
MGHPLTVPNTQELYAQHVGRSAFRGIDNSRVSTYICVQTPSGKARRTGGDLAQTI